MPPKLALSIGLAFVAAVFFRVERPRRLELSWALFWPFLWCLVASSRQVGVWFAIWGLPLPGGEADEGSLIDRSFYLVMGLIGAFILARRRIDWGFVFSENRWFFFMSAYMLLSVLWSGYSFISFKRFIKYVAAFNIAFVVLTEPQPLVAVMAILRRCAYIHMPMSIITIRYFRDIGISFDWGGTSSSWNGLCMSKNNLGQIAMVSALCFIRQIALDREALGKAFKVDYLYLAMSVYLLKGSDDALSMTSLSVFAIAILISFRVTTLRHDLRRIGGFMARSSAMILALLVLLVAHTIFVFSEHSLLGHIVLLMGRDLTLTGRTEIWSDMLAIASHNPLFGVGYGGFWIGRLANIPWNANMTWVLGQGHNGYVDAYLQIGWVGIVLLVGFIFSAGSRISGSFWESFELGRVRAVFFLVILFINITETTFLRGDHAMWFLFLIAALQPPFQFRLESDAVGIDTRNWELEPQLA